MRRHGDENYLTEESENASECAPQRMHHLMRKRSAKEDVRKRRAVRYIFVECAHAGTWTARNLR